MEQKTILIVDDEELIGELCSSILEDEGYKTVYFNNINDALAKFPSLKIDFILSDIKMPGGDGIEFKTKLNEMGNTIPFLFMTGFSSVPSEQIEQLNVLGVIKKSFSIDQLQEYIGKHLA